MSRVMCFDTFQLDDKVIREDDDELVMRGIIASEIVQKYEDGRGYKPGEELEKAAETLQLLVSRPVKSMDHPSTGLLVTRGDVNGRMENFTFHKDLKDPKTDRPMRRGIKADIVWFKRFMAPDVLDKIKNGELLDVSIGFTYEPDATPGAWNGLEYDYVQRDIFIDHLAAPVPHGRCAAPYCGIGVDQVLKLPDASADPDEPGDGAAAADKVAGDPFAGYRDFADCVAQNQEKDDPEAYCGTIQRAAEGDECPICDLVKAVGIAFDIDITEDHTRMAKGIGALMYRYLGADGLDKVLKRAHDLLGSLDHIAVPSPTPQHEGDTQEKSYDVDGLLELHRILHER